MIRLWPRSLAGQLSLILVGAVVAAQLAAFALLSGDRSDVRRGATRTQSIDRLAVLLHTIEAVPPDLVDEIIAAFDTPRHRFSVSSTSLVSADTMDDDEKQLADTLTRRLKPAADPRVALVERDQTNAVRRHSKRPHALQVSVKLADGRWLNEEASFRLGYGRRAIALLLVSIFAIVLTVTLAVRWITRPLTTLASAAERLGRGEAVTPLIATGPSELKGLVETFNVMQQRVSHYVKDRARMVAAISHDLRTPITALRLRAEMIDDEALRAAMVRTLVDMQRMTEATLAFARDDATLEQTRTTDLVALIDAVADDSCSAGEQVTLQTPEHLPYRCRPMALRRAFGNLIENAVRYGDRARVSLQLTEGHVSVNVDDDGPGVPTDRLEEVFEPFVRVDTSRSEQTGGIGLGLAIARSVVRAHGGTIVLLNRPEGGLRVHVTLPLPQSAESSPELPVAADRLPPMHDSTRQPLET